MEVAGRLIEPGINWPKHRLHANNSSAAPKERSSWFLIALVGREGPRVQRNFIDSTLITSIAGKSNLAVEFPLYSDKKSGSYEPLYY
jgi:hypothetical protein